MQSLLTFRPRNALFSSLRISILSCLFTHLMVDLLLRKRVEGAAIYEMYARSAQRVHFIDHTIVQSIKENLPSSAPEGRYCECLLKAR